MVEELWPIKKYEGDRPVWDCREWLVEALQGEILDHVRRYNHPYVLILSEEPIWTQVAYENRRDKRYTVGMQKLSPLEISMIVTPFFRKGYKIYQDEKSKCVKISRKEIPELNTLQMPPDIVQGPAGTSRLDQIWAKEESNATDYMMELLRYRGFNVVKKCDKSETSIKFIIYLEHGGPTVDAEIKVIGKNETPSLFYQSMVEMDEDTTKTAGYSANMLESHWSRTANEAAAWIVKAIENINRQRQINGKTYHDNNDR
nr:MAG TPA: hypothetical protein [Crassvirales sp.]